MSVAPGLSRTSIEPATRVEPGTYLSDGSRLLRVVEGLSWPPEESWVVLEDCRTLEEHTFTPDELWAMGLRNVR
jgi:hypothetical protein